MDDGVVLPCPTSLEGGEERTSRKTQSIVDVARSETQARDAMCGGEQDVSLLPSRTLSLLRQLTRTSVSFELTRSK